MRFLNPLYSDRWPLQSQRRREAIKEILEGLHDTGAPGDPQALSVLNEQSKAKKPVARRELVRRLQAIEHGTGSRVAREASERISEQYPS